MSLLWTKLSNGKTIGWWRAAAWKGKVRHYCDIMYGSLCHDGSLVMIQYRIAWSYVYFGVR